MKRSIEEEDELDMFGEEIIQTKPIQLTEAAPVVRAGGTTLTGNFDDPDGYYREVLGEVLNDRYHVYSVLGKGVFSSVVRAKDNKASKEQGMDVDVAIKVGRVINERSYGIMNPCTKQESRRGISVCDFPLPTQTGRSIVFSFYAISNIRTIFVWFSNP
jgi:hypothetical protein